MIQTNVNQSIENTSGMDAFSPGIFKLGYDGGGPYLCIAINHGGGIRCFPCKNKAMP